MAPILLVSGCWEKIEYSGSAASSAPKSPATTTVEPLKKVGASNLPEPVEVEAPSTTVAKPLPRPNSDDDRYAIPANASNAVKKNGTDLSAPPLPPENAAAADPVLEPTWHTGATPVSATVDVAPVTNTRRAAWLLGSKLSMAALAHDRGMAPNFVPTWFEEARTAAKQLGVSVTDLPAPAPAGDPAPASTYVIDYLLRHGQSIGPYLAKQYGSEQVALFEVALKSNLLILLYSPGSNESRSLAAAIGRAAPQAKLPAEQWQPLVNLVEKQASVNDVRTAVRQMHTEVDRYLANGVEPTGQ